MLLPIATSAKRLHLLDQRRIALRPGDDFEQAHVARRVEEMRDHEVARKTRPACPRSSLASGIVEVFDEIGVPCFRTASSRR